MPGGVSWDFVRFDDPIMEVRGLSQVDRNERFNECTQ